MPKFCSTPQVAIVRINLPETRNALSQDVRSPPPQRRSRATSLGYSWDCR